MKNWLKINKLYTKRFAKNHLLLLVRKDRIRVQCATELSMWSPTFGDTCEPYIKMWFFWKIWNSLWCNLCPASQCVKFVSLNKVLWLTCLSIVPLMVTGFCVFKL
jgi:hypothetical protein